MTYIDSLTRVKESTRVTILVIRTRLESHWKKCRLDSSHVFHRMILLDSSHSQWLESDSFLQNLWVPDKQTHFVCTQRNEHFCSSDDQDWRNFCFACLVVLCYILRIKCPNLHRGRPETFFHRGVSRAQYIGSLSWFNAVFEYCDPGSGPHTVTWVFSRCQ